MTRYRVEISANLVRALTAPENSHCRCAAAHVPSSWRLVEMLSSQPDRGWDDGGIQVWSVEDDEADFAFAGKLVDPEFAVTWDEDTQTQTCYVKSRCIRAD